MAARSALLLFAALAVTTAAGHRRRWAFAQPAMLRRPSSRGTKGLSHARERRRRRPQTQGSKVFGGGEGDNNGGDTKNPLAKAWTNFSDEFDEDEMNTYVQTLIFCLAIRFFLVEPRYIPSLSMFPTFDVGDQLAVEKVTKIARPLLEDAFPVRRNEVLVFNPPPAFQDLVTGSAKREALIKRCVAIAGDEVQIKNGILFVNGQAQFETFINERPDYDLPKVTVPPENVFVLGDNRNQSLDSHIWGFLPVKNIIGRAVLTYWPPGRFGSTVPKPTGVTVPQSRDALLKSFVAPPTASAL